MTLSHPRVARAAASATVVLALGCPQGPEGEGDASPGEASPTGGVGGETAGPDAAELAEWSKGMFGVLPEVAEPSDYELTDAKVDLGRMLYYEKRISKDEQVSCNTCHPLDEFGVDHEPISIGHDDQEGEFNAPTVYNSALQTAQFWDARAADVEEQALGPLTNPVEMAMGSNDEVIERLKGISSYAPLFEEAFPDAEDPFTIENVGIAIGAFERKLQTPSRFDEFMAGDHDALGADELAGLAVFKETNCQMCHMGPLVGGQMQQMFGLQKAWPKEPGSSEPHPDSKTMFKVPQLRNVTRTQPYLHDGSITDLKQLTKMMAEYQLGTQLSDEEAEQLVAFLGALEGEIPEEYVAKPELPDGGGS